MLKRGRVPPIEMNAKNAVQAMEWHLQNGIACCLTLSNPHLTEDCIASDAINAKLMDWLNKHQKRHYTFIRHPCAARQRQLSQS